MHGGARILIQPTDERGIKFDYLIFLYEIGKCYLESDATLTSHTLYVSNRMMHEMLRRKRPLKNNMTTYIQCIKNDVYNLRSAMLEQFFKYNVSSILIMHLGLSSHALM